MNEITFKPRATNIIRYQLVGLLIGMPIAMGLAMLFMTDLLVTLSWKESLLFWLALSSAGILGGVFGQFLVLKKSLEMLSITISDGNITGPESWVWKRKSLDRGKLDKARSRRRSLFHQLFGLHCLRFQDGEKLEICDAFYGKEQIRTLLDVLELKS